MNRSYTGLRAVLTVLITSGLVVSVAGESRAAELPVGGARVSITPDQPVALAGQMRTRIAREVQSPVTATALALESRDGEKVLDAAIMISCDLVAIRDGVLDGVRQKLAPRLPDFPVEKL